MGTTMGNPECEWVRVRLPLWVGVREDRTESDDEGGDLSPDDRRSIERHLESCRCCGRHRAGLERALKTLGLVAGSLSSSSEGPSLWPALEQRMTGRPVRHHPRWLRSLHEVGDRGLRAWVDFQGERPLRFAWLRDGLEEALKGGGWAEPTDRGREVGRGRVRRAARVLGTGVAAAALVLMIGLPGMQRREEAARLTILSNAQPLPGAVTQPVPTGSATPAAAAPAADADNAPGELAQADPIPVPAPPSVEAAPASKIASTTATATPAAAATANATPAPPPTPSRWNYDLENGTPMPPHARDVKPVY
jgi:hypothetical protein